MLLHICFHDLQLVTAYLCIDNLINVTPMFLKTKYSWHKGFQKENQNIDKIIKRQPRYY